MNYLIHAVHFLIRIAFDAVVLLFLLRFFAELWRVSFHNPASQFIFRYSNPVIAPVRRWLPNRKQFNLAAVLLAFLGELVKWLLMFAVSNGMPHIGGWLLLTLGSLLSFTIMLYVVLIFVWALSSLFGAHGSGAQHPMLTFVTQLVEPAMRPLSSRLPSLGGIDFSPTVAILILLLARMLIADPLIDVGHQLALGLGG